MTPFRRLVSYFARYKRTLIIGISCVFMTNVFKLITPDFVRRAMDEMSYQRIDGLNRLRMTKRIAPRPAKPE